MAKKTKFFDTKATKRRISHENLLISSSMRKTLTSLFAIASISIVSIASAAPGDYKEISCASQAFFAANSCNQCFEGGKVTVGQKITGFQDTWTNGTKNELIAYKDEQVYPDMVSLGGAGTSWVATPNTPSLYWKYGTDVVWVNSLTGSGKQEFSLEPGKTITFMDSDFGASYALDKNDTKAGGYVGLMKFPVVYHEVGAAGGKEGAKQTHLECVAFSTAAAPAVVVPPKPQPPKLPKTGPGEMALLGGLALLLGLGVVSYRRRKA